MQIRRTVYLCLVMGAGTPTIDQVSAAEPKRTLVPLKQYIADKDFEKDPLASRYVFQRCSGLYSAYALALENETSADRVALYEKSKKVSADFLAAAAEVEMSGSSMTMEQAFEKQTGFIAKLGNAYMEAMTEARVYNGDFSQDPLIKGDLQVCTTLGSTGSK